MPALHAKRQVNHSAQEMFDLVADVERYPEFVPYCRGHVIVSRGKSGDDELLVTDMTMARGVFRETIRGRDTLDRKNCSIVVEAKAGLVRRLRTVWTFQPRSSESCDVVFDLSYEFSSLLLEFVLAAILDDTFRGFVRAFERRADVIYGAPGKSSRDVGTSSRVASAQAQARRASLQSPAA